MHENMNKGACEPSVLRRGMSRRHFLIGASIAAAQLAALGLGGCSPRGTLSETGSGSSAAAFTPGTYRGEAEGKHGPVVVEIDCSESAIEAVRVVEDVENERISRTARERIPAQIVEYQSLGVDTVTGATLTSMAILSAASAAAEEAGADVDALRSAPGAPASGETVEASADVVVVGAGASGMAAAISAAQAGAGKVVVVETTSCMGGNALVSGGYVDYIEAPDELREDMAAGYAEYFAMRLQAARDAGIDSALIDRIQADYDAYYAAGATKVYDSADFHALDYYFITGGYYPLEHWQEYSPTIINLDEWLTDLGMKWDNLMGAVGNPWPRSTSPLEGDCGEGYFNLFEDVTDGGGLPIEFIFEAPAQELITDGGRVAGVVAQGKDGTTYRVTAKRGVILATGGFSGNSDMLKQYNTYWPFDPSAAIVSTNAYGHDGHGIEMALSVGGAVEDMDNYMLFPFADCKDYSTETIVGNSGEAMMVNQEGKRFVNETMDRATIIAAMMEQTDNRGYLISDKTNSLIVDGTTYFGADEETLIARGQLFRADTIEELAGMVGIDPSVLAASVEAYNKAAETLQDPECGRTMFTATCPIDEPPFYASPRMWAAHITLGGLKVDEDWRVLGESGAPVEGLFAVGEMVNGFFGVTSMANGVDAGRKIVSA